MVKSKEELRSGEGRAGAVSAADILPDKGLTPIHLAPYQQRPEDNLKRQRVKGELTLAVAKPMKLKRSGSIHEAR